jgi:hypothetical protein
MPQHHVDDESDSTPDLFGGPNPSHLDRVRGCLLGGAVGDALGAGVEFLSLQEIRDQYGIVGVEDYVPAYGRIGAISDDTQIVFFHGIGTPLRG